MKLANYFNRQFTDHISTFEWDNNGPDNLDVANGATVPRHCWDCPCSNDGPNVSPHSSNAADAE